MVSQPLIVSHSQNTKGDCRGATDKKWLKLLWNFSSLNASVSALIRNHVENTKRRRNHKMATKCEIFQTINTFILFVSILYCCVVRDWYTYEGHCKGADGNENTINKGLSSSYVPDFDLHWSDCVCIWLSTLDQFSMYIKFKIK